MQGCLVEVWEPLQWVASAPTTHFPEDPRGALIGLVLQGIKERGFYPVPLPFGGLGVAPGGLIAHPPPLTLLDSVCVSDLWFLELSRDAY